MAAVCVSERAHGQQEEGLLCHFPLFPGHPGWSGTTLIENVWTLNHCMLLTSLLYGKKAQWKSEPFVHVTFPELLLLVFCRTNLQAASTLSLSVL